MKTRGEGYGGIQKTNRKPAQNNQPSARARPRKPFAREAGLFGRSGAKKRQCLAARAVTIN
eukprot:6537289-Heterocapsa_arctica.AAC.1